MLKKVIITIGFILSFAFAIYAHIPKYINYQGMLSDASGNPLTGNFTVNFRIYDASSGGALLWGPQTLTITADAGIFNAVLGPIEYTVFNGDERWLSLQVGSDAEMTPRKRMLSVSYSFRAHKAQEADKLGGKSASAFVQTGQANSISTNMLQNNAVTASKISPKIVSSIDGVSNDGGNINLVGGNGITITPDDANNKITIAASTPGGDNLGNHTATQNIKLNGKWLSGDGGNEGVFVKSDGKVGIGTASPTKKLDVNGEIRASSLIRGSSVTAANSGMYAYLATPNYGVYGKHKNGAIGYLGSVTYGVYGKSIVSAGVHGEGGIGVSGKSTANSIGVLGEGGTGVYGKGGSIGVYATGSSWAVWSQGSSWATGLWLASDQKLKTDVQKISSVLPKLMQLNAKTYKFKTDDAQYKHLNLPDNQQYGLNAQEVEKVFPELVTDAVQPAQTDENGNVTHPEIVIKSVNYIGVIPLLLQAIQEQQKRIDALEQRVEQMSK